ncbi:MerR family DNA-binding transcriptional regulator [Aeromicrobium sp. CnD17-E]|uniref:MerR family DNA-binding transcriptional regulator n=1 Tax=Aeromicrobium sp. CnD17-E TaxID=2954487 RepID=UPI002096BC49|nr:MerR family DNA-binding transcriptional regulator [Aeromicrobium sp. CnD17-E]MCO7237833.1 MerR family DNA-binding transcriptional regulator [Aeromicrobium sp. CnD17-E]
MSSTRLEGPTLTVGDVAAASGVAASAIRFYERQGLLTSHRTSGNQRRYDEFAPCMVRICRVAQRVGLTVQEVVALFDALPEEPTLDDWQGLTDSLVAEAERRIADLRRTLDDLASDGPLCAVPGVDDV